MDIRISKISDVPVQRQVAEQIVFLIATDELKPGEALPSVRALARRLGIHHNTVSKAYQYLVARTLLVRRRGSRLVVRGAAERAHRACEPQDLDDLINTTIRLARQQGYSLQKLRDRVRKRLLAAPPDHILVIEQEPGLRQILQQEIRQAVRWPVEARSRDELAANPGLAIGALALVPQYAITDVDPRLPKDRPAIPIAFGTADEHVALVRKLQEPSVIAVVSVSGAFLDTARGLLAPAVGRRHTLRELLLPLGSPHALRAADVVFCDSMAFKQVIHPRRVEVHLIAPASLDYLATAMESYHQI